MNPTFRVSSGLLEIHHVHNIGEAIWVYLWCINRQTGRSGLVLGGRLVKLDEIGRDLGLHRNSVLRHIRRLEDHGYIGTTRGPSGLRVEVLNQKKWPTRQHKGCTTHSESPSVSDAPRLVHGCNTRGACKIKTPERTPEELPTRARDDDRLQREIAAVDIEAVRQRGPRTRAEAIAIARVREIQRMAACSAAREAQPVRVQPEPREETQR